MKMSKVICLLAFSVLVLALAVPALAQEPGKSQPKEVFRVPAGQRQKIKGVILKRDVDNFIVRDERGMDVTVNLTNSTRVEEKKSNPFRRPRNYATTELLRGLSVEVEGRGDSNGSLTADRVKFTEDSLYVAKTVETRVTPVEGRVTDAEGRLSSAEQNAQRLSGQIEELSAISNAARGGAKAAQETADAAMQGVHATNERITNLVSSLDEYEAKKGIVVNFKVGSWVLSDDAKATLDEIATQAKNEHGFVIEVTGFASSDGKLDMNRRLSQQRADAVVRYLAENHMIPLRRIITPFGYGVSQPIADNSTRDGRQQNRRVEVKILVNRGLTGPSPAAQTSTSEETAGGAVPLKSTEAAKRP